MMTIPRPKIDAGPFHFQKDTRRRATGTAVSPLPPTWQARLCAMFPLHTTRPFSQPHSDLWQWADAIDLAAAPLPFVALWARGRGKSTNAEMVVADLGARKRRLYCLYASETQDQADKHVGTVARMLESDTIGRYFPEVGRPRLGRNGSRSWNRTTLQAANGYTVEAIGLDKAVRGQKIDWVRPDLIVFDDIDARHDGQTAVKKKEETITTSILPAGSPHCAVLFVQNLIHDNSIATRLAKQPGTEGAADYLANRIVSGPYQAVDDLRYEFRQEGDALRWHITKGVSLWEGWSILDCENEINREGPTAFEIESQHAIDTDSPNALLSSDILNATRTGSSPDLFKVGVAVDPSGGAGQCGIVAGGIAKLGKVTHGYTLVDNTTPIGTSAADWGTAVLRTYHAVGADVIYVERNFGGDMAKNTIRTAVLDDGEGNVILSGAHVPIIEVNASRGKEVRAQPVSSLFQQGVLHHVGFFPELERQWTRWEPGTNPSPNNLDAEVWLYTGLMKITGNAPPASYESVTGLGAVENYSSPWE